MIPRQEDECCADGLVHGVRALYDQLKGQWVDTEGEDSHEGAAEDNGHALVGHAHEVGQ